MHVNPKKVAVVGAVMRGGWHLVWSLLVLVGWAQALVGFSMCAHMVHTAVVIGPFEAGAAATVVIIASFVGYVVGYILATVWNKVHSA